MKVPQVPIEPTATDRPWHALAADEALGAL